MSLLLVTPVYASSVEYVEAPEEVKEIVEPTWQEEFLTLPKALQNTALCESDIDRDGLPNPEAENPYSTASGILQMIDGTYAWLWSEVYGTPVDWTLKNDPKVQMELGLHLYNKAGLSHWEYPCGTLNS